MEDQKDKTADPTADQDSKGEQKDKSETSKDEAIDYGKELEEQVEKFERAEQNREGYQKRKAKSKESTEQETEQESVNDIEAQVSAALAKQLPKVVSKLQSTIAEDNVETMLNELAPGNSAKQKLIRFHFENSVMPNGTIRERMENALLIADKKAIQKRQSELATALKNRQGLGASGLGTSTEGQQVSDNILSADQLKDLKARGWDDKKIDRFKQNLRR